MAPPTPRPPRVRYYYVSSSPALIIGLTLSMLCLGQGLAAVAGGAAGATGSTEDEDALRVKVLDKPTEATSGVPLLVTATVNVGAGSDTSGAGGGGGSGLRPRLFNRNYGNLVNGGGASSPLNVRLHYRAMFGEEKSLAMELKPPPPSSSSLPNAPSASNAYYAASIPAEDFPGYGQMIRYWVTATTARSSLSGDDGARLLKSYARKPRREDNAYGAVVDAAAVAAESTLPTLHWFVEDTNGALWDDPVEAFVAFDPAGPAEGPAGGGAGEGGGLKFYGGGVTVRRRGSGRRDVKNMWGKSGSKDWPKRKFKLDFRGRDFEVNWVDNREERGGGGGRSKVEEVNLHSSYDEPGPESYLREALAAAAFRHAGVPAPAAKHVVLRQNGNFYGLYVMVENVDDAFLERQGYDPSGPLFKAVHWKYSNLRPAAPAWAPCAYAPEWEHSWGPCPEVYRYSTKKKGGGGADDEWNAKGELGALLESLDTVNRGGDTTRLWDSVVRRRACSSAKLRDSRLLPPSGLLSGASLWWSKPPAAADDDDDDNRANCRTCSIFSHHPFTAGRDWPSVLIFINTCFPLPSLRRVLSLLSCSTTASFGITSA